MLRAASGRFADREGEPDMRLPQDNEVAMNRLASMKRRDLDIDNRDEGDVAPIQRVREARLVALAGKGHIADDHVRVCLELHPFDAALRAASPLPLD